MRFAYIHDALTGNPTGWRRNVAAFMFGVAGTLTLAPFFIFPLLILSYGGLYLLIDRTHSPKRAFLDGWWWGWGYYISGLYWFCIALLTEPEKFAWLIPFALFALTAVIALYSGVACLIISRLWVKGRTKIFMFAVIWTLVEYARAHLFSGFPWNLPGYSFAFSDSALQLASLVGIYGLSWFAVWLGALPAILLDPRTTRRKAQGIVLGSWALLAAGMVWGNWQLSHADEGEQYVEGVHLRLVQANIAQHHKWDPRLQMQGLQQYVRMTLSPDLDKITHVIWPETAVPYVLKNDSPLSHMLGAAIGSSRFLIAGALRTEQQGERAELFNSIMVVDGSGQVIGSYDKGKLVPFGEFLPFRPWLPAFLTTPVGAQDFGSGPGPVTLEWPGLPGVSPLICYEAIFPQLAVSAKQRPQWLLNVTNDAWFGFSSGPHQHFHMARMRAVEQGLPLVRVANTGITAVTDRFGQVLVKLDLGEQGIIDSGLPIAKTASTLYADYGDSVIGLLILLGLILIIRQQKTRLH